jgi:adenylate kinase
MVIPVRKRVVVLGPPGGGKQTLIEAFGKKGFKYGQISPGEIGRKEKERGTDLGYRIAAYQDAGLLAPLEDIKELMRPWVKKYLDFPLMFLDGFPRNLEQKGLFFEFCDEYDFGAVEVVNVQTPLALCRERLVAAKRGRSDDGDPKVAEARLRVFLKETTPVIDFFEHGDGKHRVHFNSIDGSDMEVRAPQYVDDFIDMWGVLSDNSLPITQSA